MLWTGSVQSAEYPHLAVYSLQSALIWQRSLQNALTLAVYSLQNDLDWQCSLQNALIWHCSVQNALI
jgi:hypothetical protein